jgi:hypothetical protein
MRKSHSLEDHMRLWLVARCRLPFKIEFKTIDFKRGELLCP